MKSEGIVKILLTLQRPEFSLPAKPVTTAEDERGRGQKDKHEQLEADSSPKTVQISKDMKIRIRIRVYLIHSFIGILPAIRKNTEIKK